MSRKPVRRKPDGKVRVYGLGWVTPKVAVILVTIVLILFFVDFYLL